MSSAQPLHAMARGRGGNDDIVHWDGQQKSLHHVWDTRILAKLLQEKYANDESNMILALEQSISTLTSTYGRRVERWTACLDKPNASVLECTLAWTTEANRVACSVALPLFDRDPSADLSTAYYQSVRHGVEMILVKTAVRLAVVLERVLSKCAILPVVHE